jgi:hypothetical protein
MADDVTLREVNHGFASTPRGRRGDASIIAPYPPPASQLVGER